MVNGKSLALAKPRGLKKLGNSRKLGKRLKFIICLEQLEWYTVFVLLPTRKVGENLNSHLKDLSLASDDIF